MRSDFLDAHRRHGEDAKRLFEAGRWANADHLYGMAAECGLKRLMLVFGMPYDPGRDKPQRRDDRQHADAIWARYESYRHGHPHGAAYALPAGNPFADWDISQRYGHQNQFDQARVESHKTAAQWVHRLIRQALLDGLI